MSKYNIRRDLTQRNKWYVVLYNPKDDCYESEVLFGGSVEIVERKINKQLKKWGGTRQ